MMACFEEDVANGGDESRTWNLEFCNIFFVIEMYRCMSKYGRNERIKCAQALELS